MAERGLRVLDASGLLIILRDGPELEVVAEAGDAHPRVRRLPIAGTALGGMVVDSGSLLLERPSAREAPWLSELGLAMLAVLAEPLPLGKQPGLMIATRSQPVAFDRRDATAAHDLARALVERLEAERSRERERLLHGVRARELERARWARELHDETVQDLGALRLLLAGARDGDEVDELRHAIGAAIGHVDREVEALRHLITALRPAVLDDLGLVEGLEALARRAGAVDHLPVQTEIATEGSVPRLDPEVESAIYRIAQEALTNAAKHSGATRALLAFRIEGHTLTVSVSDDGKGFSAAESPKRQADRLLGPAYGVGVSGMEERAELVGAKLEISSAPGTGTTVRVSVPLPEG